LNIEIRNYTRGSLLKINLIDMSYETKTLEGDPITPPMPPFKVFEDGGLKTVCVEDLWNTGRDRSYDDVIVKLLEFPDRTEVFVRMKGADHTELKVVDYVIDKPKNRIRRGYLIFSRGFEVLPTSVESVSIPAGQEHSVNFTTANGYITDFHLMVEGLASPEFKIEIGYNGSKLVEYLGHMLAPMMYDLTNKRYWYTFSSALPPNTNCYIKIINLSASDTITVGSLYIIPRNMIYRLIKAYVW